jgi:hypothetical protein
MHASLSRLAIHGLIALVVGVFSASAQINIYWSMTDGSGAYVVRADANGSNRANIVSGIANIRGPNGLETANGLLYWPDQQLNAIQQANMDGSGVVTFATASNPYDVFGTAQKIYWTSLTGNYIDTQLPNGTGYQRLLENPNVDKPFAIEVTSSNIYWSQVVNSSSGSLLRSDLNGNNVVTLIPNVVIYDFQVTSNYIYFADIRYPGGALKRANLDGTAITNLVTAPFGGVDLINGICITTNFIYWSEYSVPTGGGIRRASLGGTGRVDLYNAPPGSGIRGVVVLPEVAAPAAPPLFTSSALSPGGFAFTLQVESGRTYRVETSGNLTNWTEITNFVSAGNSVTLTNVIPPGASNLFFRAKTP